MFQSNQTRHKWLTCLLAVMFFAAFILPAGHARAAENAGTCPREVLQAVVHVSGASLSGLLQQIPDERERAEVVRKFVRPVRFFPDNSGYIYVYTMDGLVVGHGGMPNLEGTNLIDHRDAKGGYDVRMAIRTAKAGGGFFEHYWQKPGLAGEFKKITYVETVAGTRYFIGAGAYIP
ncbi:MAG: cache domain-containing protein [Deltaproteobacteria bacterium]